MNDIIIKEFEKLLKQILHDIDIEKDAKKKTANIFRLKQISNALNIIKSTKFKIISGEQLKDVKGIGKGIMKRIDEIVKTGKLEEITLKVKDYEKTESIDELKEIYGIGDKIAHEIIEKYNIRTIAELKSAQKKGKIELNNNILLGLKYHGKYKQKIPRKEMTKMEEYLKNIVKQIDTKLRVKICGSYRRQKPFSNDIDCMLSHPKIVSKDDLENKKNYLQLLIGTLKANEFIVDSLTSDSVKTKFMGFCQFTKKKPIRRIDIRYIPFESYYTALLYFTGSGSFNQGMRQHAKKMGYKLNEYGLFKLTTNKKICVESEKDIFAKLEMDYVEPKDRL
jgi:DNA polymerase/3'-5' exonuclease PolX